MILKSLFPVHKWVNHACKEANVRRNGAVLQSQHGTCGLPCINPTASFAQAWLNFVLECRWERKRCVRQSWSIYICSCSLGLVKLKIQHWKEWQSDDDEVLHLQPPGAVSSSILNNMKATSYDNGDIFMWCIVLYRPYKNIQKFETQPTYISNH